MIGDTVLNTFSTVIALKCGRLPDLHITCTFKTLVSEHMKCIQCKAIVKSHGSKVEGKY